MRNHGRKYGEKDSRPIPLWNGPFDRYGRIGKPIWTFAWLIDRVTKEIGGIGRVLGGAPIKIGDIDSIEQHLLRRLARRNPVRDRGRVIDVSPRMEGGRQ